MLRPGDILENKYEILTLIGQGGMSKVWLAKDLNLNKQWAVKEINKASSGYRNTVDESKTLREIEIMKTLDHPALPRIVDVIDDESILCVVMDYIQGETLQGVLDMYGPQPENAVVTWMLEVCDILTYLHSQKPPIIYRDLKPSNLMLNYDGHIRIIDFGIAREYKGKGDTMPLGSEGYASPEHFTKSTDIRSDVYTVGSTMYTLLTGKDQTQPPYYIQPLRKVNPSLSQGLEKIIAKTTKKDPNERYQTAAELANALESYEKLDDEYIEALKGKVRAYKRRFIAAIAIMVIGIAVTAAGFITERNDYNNIVQSPGGTLEAKEANLERAISLRPKEEAAYIALIQAYSEDGKFTEEESARFFSIYNKRKSAVSKDVNYDIGEAYLSYYTGETDSSARAKLLTAEPFFSAAIGGEQSSKAESYVYLADCYRKFVMSDDSLLTTNIDKKDLQELLTSGKRAVDNADNAKMKAIVAEAVINLIEIEKLDMRDHGIKEEKLTKVIDAISGSVGTPEITSMADEAKKGIHASYESAKKKEGGTLTYEKEPEEGGKEQ